LDPDHLVRPLLELVDTVLGRDLRSRCLNWGGFDYDPVCMFSVLVFGLMRGVRSGRRLEEACRYDVRYHYLSGHCTPKHWTFSDFVKDLGGGQELERLALVVVEAAFGLGLVSGKNLFVDGTKIPSSASQWRKYIQEMAANDSLESDVDEPATGEGPCEGPVHHSKSKGPKAKGKKPKAARQVKPCSDPEARTMAGPHKAMLVGYNMQLAVDSGGIVLGAVATNECNDSKVLGQVLEAVKTQSGVVPKRVIADKGYDSADNHAALSDIGATSFICPRSGVSPFKPDEHGTLRCLAGHEPTTIQTRKRGVEYTVLRVNCCRGCVLAEACGKTGAGHQREYNVRDESHLSAKIQNAERYQRAKGVGAARNQIVEHANARLKRDFSLKRLLTKGLKGAQTELLLACIAMNLMTILKAQMEVLAAVLGGFWRFLALAERTRAQTL